MSDLDMQACEHCGTSVPIEDAIPQVDIYLCSKCYAEWKGHFDACDHAWEPSHDEFGEPGRYCGRCAGFVPNEAEAA